jgi:hypothetical protein
VLRVVVIVVVDELRADVTAELEPDVRADDDKGPTVEELGFVTFTTPQLPLPKQV